jgi:transposase
VSFLAKESPLLTLDYAWWIGRLCEIAAVSRVAELVDQDATTTWRLDFARLKMMMAYNKIPKAKRISVDEVYALKKPENELESRNERFFTVISDLDTRRVIGVSESRSKKALDEFFHLIGAQACSEIEVVAVDQHEDYAASVKEYCKSATLVWDRFHILQAFEEAVNDTSKWLHDERSKGSDLHRLTHGGFRFLFLKKASRRTDSGKTHINDVLRENTASARLELIKEGMITFFHEPDEKSALKVFNEVGD